LTIPRVGRDTPRYRFFIEKVFRNLEIFLIIMRSNQSKRTGTNEDTVDFSFNKFWTKLEKEFLTKFIQENIKYLFYTNKDYLVNCAIQVERKLDCVLTE